MIESLEELKAQWHSPHGAQEMSLAEDYIFVLEQEVIGYQDRIAALEKENAEVKKGWEDCVAENITYEEDRIGYQDRVDAVLSVHDKLENTIVELEGNLLNQKKVILGLDDQLETSQARVVELKKDIADMHNSAW